MIAMPHRSDPHVALSTGMHDWLLVIQYLTRTISLTCVGRMLLPLVDLRYCIL